MIGYTGCATGQVKPQDNRANMVQIGIVHDLMTYTCSKQEKQQEQTTQKMKEKKCTENNWKIWQLQLGQFTRQGFESSCNSLEWWYWRQTGVQGCRAMEGSLGSKKCSGGKYCGMTCSSGMWLPKKESAFLRGGTRVVSTGLRDDNLLAVNLPTASWLKEGHMWKYW